MAFVTVTLLIALVVCYVALGGVHLGAGIVSLLGGRQVQEVVNQTRRAGWELTQCALLGGCGLLYFSVPRLFFVFAGPLVIPFLALLICALCSGLALVLSRYRMISVVFFSIAAFGVPFCLGLLAGSLVLGRLDLFALGTYGYYFRPWLNIFCITLGLFLVSLFWFFGANFFSAESESLKKTAVGLSGLVLSFGSLVFISGELYELALFTSLFRSPLALVAMVAFGVLWILFSVWVHQRGGRLKVRWVGLGFAMAIVVGWMGLFFPDIARFHSGETIVLIHSVQSGWAGPLLGVLGLVACCVGTLFSVEFFSDKPS